MLTLQNLLIIFGIWFGVSFLAAAAIAAVLRATSQDHDA